MRAIMKRESRASSIQLRLCAGSICLFIAVFLALIQLGQAEGKSGVQPSEKSDLAQELTNPLANLVTIPVQMNYDSNIGLQDEGWKLQTNIQPV